MTPVSPSDPEATDALLARELNQMSIQEREKVYDDIHGVSDIVDETDDLVNHTLSEFDEEIALIAKKSAYEMAEKQDASYVRNRKMRCKFLRAEGFNSRLAAKRMVSFFEAKLELFGPSRLTQDIRLEDLDEQDMNCLESGMCQIIHRRDRAGRALLGISPGRKPSICTSKNQIRMLFYILMSASDDEETQIKGIVFLFFNMRPNPPVEVDWEVGWKLPPLLTKLPVRVVAGHLCYDDCIVPPLISAIRNACGRFLRLRFRVHQGSPVEVQYILMTFGILVGDLMNADGELWLEYHRSWLDERRKIESLQPAENKKGHGIQRIVVPGSNDVVFGRDRFAQEHPGNTHYIFLIDCWRLEHGGQPDSTKRKEKTAIANRVVETITGRGGRFLRRDELGWVEVDGVVARYKVASSFRSRRKADKRKAQTREKTMAAKYRAEEQALLRAIPPLTLEADPHSEVDSPKRPRFYYEA